MTANPGGGRAPTTHPPEYEREVISTLRLVRRVIQLALIGVGIMLVLAILVAVGGLVSVRGTTGEIRSAGQDMHAPLRPGSSISNTTEAGLKVSATISNVTWTHGGRWSPPG